MDYFNILNNIKRYDLLNPNEEKEFISILKTTKIKCNQIKFFNIETIFYRIISFLFYR